MLDRSLLHALLSCPGYLWHRERSSERFGRVDGFGQTESCGGELWRSEVPVGTGLVSHYRRH